jgi:dihydropteroate synthase
MKINLAHTNIPKLMGILNVTEDSFSDGSKFLDTQAAYIHAVEMINSGAGIIDIGAESTRPGSLPMDEAIEARRVTEVLALLKKDFPDILYSIDTRKASVARAAIFAGADIINDISALRYDPAMAELIAANPQTKLILMHMQGEPETMQLNPHYDNVISELLEFFAERLQYCAEQGISRENILLDPGIGFGKTLQHNLDILSNLESFRQFGLPIVLGASRKSFIDKIVPSLPTERLEGSLAASASAVLQGVDILRVHDVKEHNKFLQVFAAIITNGGTQ